jgi:hypothetical protein
MAISFFGHDALRQSSIRRFARAPVLGRLRQLVVGRRDLLHDLLRLRIKQLAGEATSLFGSFLPVLRIIDYR